MDYKFECNSHGDIILKAADYHNLGCHHLLEFPTMLWLHHLQCCQTNIFTEFCLSKQPNEISSELSELIELAFNQARQLPLSVDEFNKKTYRAGFARFTNGSNKISYKFELRGNNLLNLEVEYMLNWEGNFIREKPPKLLSLSLMESKILAEAYIKFSQSEKGEGIGKYQTEIMQLVAKLGEYPIVSNIHA